MSYASVSIASQTYSIILEEFLLPIDIPEIVFLLYFLMNFLSMFRHFTNYILRGGG